ncbi:DNA polymerase III subunit delta [Clostridium estertheticum]|uniref:DNA polymerase III subunit delta n=1 Tax=Clostridium estertheticum TaxID=238834 RepID=UPI001CF0FFAC|nr:DNA polymerase III subunit delta [Clostridium estertheticum]MCB2306581.1 DNA polymerase III subunit delta [Clostridium estertheticum]MCB2345169.1 DNA polymerase III subunit delta [Clostridium estertheticum]MCB2350057.1 DNA polymerase III subunit delta [Clostridium estertheticum]WAG44350.1 DNA polymerase III subunit delta [Clostridium estertheticum]
MINYAELEKKIKKHELDNCYIFCGSDEKLIKDHVEYITNSVLDKNFIDLNYSKFDGSKTDFETISDACETMPFMSDKKVVVVYRAAFLEDNPGTKNSNDLKNKNFLMLNEYLKNPPPQCILIIYYTFLSDREKPSNKIKKLDKKACVIKVDKLKGESLQKICKNLFEGAGAEIGKSELVLFCSQVDNNMNIIINEVEKLVSFANGKEITKKDILAMMPQKSENDIFNLVDYLSQKNIRRALDILNELIYRGEKIPFILFMVTRQFNLLFNIKLGTENGKTKELLSSELRLHPYVCEKMISQSNKFTIKRLKRNIELCLETEKVLKSTSTDDKTNIEVFMVKTVM